MSKIIEFCSPTGSAQNGTHCWLCQKAVLLRALFCHHCGTIQPVRQLDHFARLGIEKRIDIDFGRLEKQFNTLKRALDPTRFSIRGSGEKGHAAKHLEALEEAFETLRDPVRRGRYWIQLHDQETEEEVKPSPKVTELLEELNAATKALQCDRLAQKTGQFMENGILSLMQYLRNQEWQKAREMLAEIEALESILRNIRKRRSELALLED